MAENLSNINYWGSPNEDKGNSPVRWTHDFLLNANTVDTSQYLKDPSVLIPYILDCNLEDATKVALYEGVNEYKLNDITIEEIDGFQYTEYKIYGESFDFDAALARLKAAGANNHKPDLALKIPDVPPYLDMEKVNAQRFDYEPDKLEKDQTIAKNDGIMSAIRTVFGVSIFVVMMSYLGMEVFVPKLQDVTPDSNGYVTQRGDYIIYEHEKRMFIFRLASEEFEYDTTYSIFIPEGVRLTKKVIVDRIHDNEGNIVYNIGNRIVDFDVEPTSEYDFVNGKPFEFDAYATGDESRDWFKYGELEKGNAQDIMLEGTIKEADGNYVLTFGRMRVLLGPISDTEPAFYEALTDDISYGAALYALNSSRKNNPRSVRLMGQIQKTLTSAEGRNTIKKVGFSFKIDYIRAR